MFWIHRLASHHFSQSALSSSLWYIPSVLNGTRMVSSFLAVNSQFPSTLYWHHTSVLFVRNNLLSFQGCPSNYLWIQHISLLHLLIYCRRDAVHMRHGVLPSHDALALVAPSPLTRQEHRNTAPRRVNRSYRYMKWYVCNETRQRVVEA